MDHHMLQQDKDEPILTVVKRSLFGVWPHLFFALVFFVAFLGLIYTVARYPSAIEGLGSSGSVLLFATLSWLLIELVIYVLIITYLGNKIVVTTESLLQRLQNTLFHHKTSQLRLSDIQDVTFSQNGFFAQTFNFGTINIETAGEQVNFVFTYAKDPTNSVRIIIEAQEALAERGHMKGHSPLTPTSTNESSSTNPPTSAAQA